MSWTVVAKVRHGRHRATLTLEEHRAHVARLAERLAVARLAGRDVGTDLALASHQRDVLDRQLSWVNRRSAWSWPTAPAWTD